MPGRHNRFTPRSRPSSQQRFLQTILCALAACCCGHVWQLRAQDSAGFADHSDTVRGVVVNSITHEPISRALVLSPDNTYATLTDDQGRFSFTFPRVETGVDQNSNPYVRNGQTVSPHNQMINRPTSLVARKVGFLASQDAADITEIGPPQQELTIALVPEARIIGHVIVPGSERSDKIIVQLYRRNLQEGREHWDPAATAQTRADGSFRFADLSAGSYRLFTIEQIDRDPLTVDPRGQQFGFPPVYYPGAADFATAAVVRLAPGENFQATLSLAKKEYYQVKVGFTNAPSMPQVAVNVWPQGHPGPGYSLGYNPRQESIQGSLPNGDYTIQVSTFGENPMAATENISVRGTALREPAITLLPTGSILVNVLEQFQHRETQSQPSPTFYTPNRGGTPFAQSPRRPDYLQVRLISEEQFGFSSTASLRPPQGPEDESLVIEKVQPGRFRLLIDSSVGYAAAATCGGTDLLRQPLVVGPGATVPSIEITMRDDGADVEVVIEPAAGSEGLAARPSSSAQPPAIVYLVPVDRTGDRSKTVWVNAGGTLTVNQIPPGTYRAVALDRPDPELDFPNEEAVSRYGSQLQTLVLVADQKAHLRLPLTAAKD